jgi:ABC-type Fe3+/spermidine/putrescine transport system ATPase subunit
MTAALQCVGVTVDLGSTRAVDKFDVVVARGETVAILGPSGSGKSTLLYAVAGLVDLEEGSISIEGEVVSAPGTTRPPNRRPVGFVFQHYALWPHLDAVDTVAYPLRREGRSRKDAEREATRLLEVLGVSELGGRRPAEMSGGQQQRVGLARALARSASLYLFDEPTAHLDAAARAGVQEEISRRRVETGAAAIYATHDSAEALAASDRVAVIREGKVVQAGTPLEVYERPVDVFSAMLAGPASVIDVQVDDQADGRARVRGAGLDLMVDAPSSFRAGRAGLMIRPEWVCSGGDLAGVVREVWFRGTHTDYRLDSSAGRLDVRLPGPPTFSVGQASGWTIRRGWLLAGAG